MTLETFEPRIDLATGNGAWPDLDLRPSRDPDPLIPPGEYEGRAIRAEVHPSIAGRLKLFIEFELVGGRFDGTRVLFIATMPRRGRGVSPSAKLYRSWVAANMGRRPGRRDRMALSVFKHKILPLRVRTVVRDHLGRSLAPTSQYSVVDEILAPTPNSPSLSPTPTPAPTPSPLPSPSPTPPNPQEESRRGAQLRSTDGNSGGRVDR